MNIDRLNQINEVIEQIKRRNFYTVYPEVAHDFIHFIADEEASFPNLQGNEWLFESYLLELLGKDYERWDSYDERLINFLMSLRPIAKFSAEFYYHWVRARLDEGVTSAFLEGLSRKLANLGIPKGNILAGIISAENHGFIKPNNELTSVGSFILERIDTHFDDVYQAVANHYQARCSNLLAMIFEKRPNQVDAYLNKFFQRQLNHYGFTTYDSGSVKVMLRKDATKYESSVLGLIQNATDPEFYAAATDLLIEYLPQKHQSRAVDYSFAYFDRLLIQVPLNQHYNQSVQYDLCADRSSFLYFEKLEFLLDQADYDRVRSYFLTWLTQWPVTPYKMLELFVDKYSQKSIELVMTGLRMDTTAYNWQYSIAPFFKRFFKLLTRLDYSDYYPQIWALTRHKSKQMRDMAAVTLAKLGEKTIPEAEKLLNDKKETARQTGALILSLIRTDEAQAILQKTLEMEKNDDARDVMLQSLAGRLPVPTTRAELTEMVEKARQRGKLAAPLASFLTETALPKLYWQSSGEELDVDTVRFLFYRQHRSKDIRPDLEARPLYDLIDRQRSSPFAHAVLKAYFEAGADAKNKACLTVGGMLGGDNEVDLIKAKVNQWVEAKRGKMAEYAVQALALIGSNKALRAVEFFSRKYKNKNANIGKAATEAFTIAAETLNISPYDLADSIIPDFGFDGLFRTFEAGGETYRAFVGNDFKIAFLNEDNKLIKTIPKAAAPALKDEFKEIGKEIRDIVKAQSGRLEQYLVTQRKWPSDAWQRFFLGNPVMFAYAVRLIWGVFDESQQLLFAFQCQEDQTLVNEEGDEVELPDNAAIGMVHPLTLAPDQIQYWSDGLADANIEPIFPQLTRRVVLLPEEGKNLTMDRQFAGVEYGGYGFVAKMEKMGWARGSVVDAGSIASYYKDFTDLGITAIVLQEGNLGVGYYDENAALGGVMFARAKSVQFGSYQYDEPGNESDARLLRFKDVPPIVYSEVIGDLLFFKENDARKTTNDLNDN